MTALEEGCGELSRTRADRAHRSRRVDPACRPPRCRKRIRWSWRSPGAIGAGRAVGRHPLEASASLAPPQLAQFRSRTRPSDPAPAPDPGETCSARGDIAVRLSARSSPTWSRARWALSPWLYPPASTSSGGAAGDARGLAHTQRGVREARVADRSGRDLQRALSATVVPRHSGQGSARSAPDAASAPPSTSSPRAIPSSSRCCPRARSRSRSG